jgi:hypothetical protein
VISLPRFLEILHSDGREATREVVMRSLEGDGAFRAEYRAVLPDRGARGSEPEGKLSSTGAVRRCECACVHRHDKRKAARDP